jgi:peptidoglycan hydrolase-like protein with peptidoglycan-binding domain
MATKTSIGRRSGPTGMGRGPGAARATGRVPSAGAQRVVGPTAGPDALVALQRAAGNAAVAGLMVQREAEGAGLQADRFKGSAKLQACFANRDRLREHDPDRDAVTRVQQALLELPGKTGNTYDLGTSGADGAYGPKTAGAVRKFKADEALGSTQMGDVGPGTMGRLDEIFGSGGGGNVNPPVPDKRREQEILGQLFHNRDLENTFDKIMLQYGKMTAQQGAALTTVQKDLATTESAEPSIAQTVLKAAAEQVIDRTLGGGDSLRKVVGDALKGISSSDLVQSGMDKAVSSTFDAAVEGGKDVVKTDIAPTGIATQPLATFIDAQHNALLESGNQAQSEFVARKQGSGQNGDEGLRTFTDSDRAQIMSTFPAVVDPRVGRAQQLLTGLEDATAKAREKEYTSAIRQWSVGNAQHATDDGFNPGGTPVTDGNALRGKATNAVPGVLEVSISFNPRDPKSTPAVTGLSISGLSQAVRTKLDTLQGDTPLRDLGYVERVSGSAGGVEIGEVKTETGQIFNTDTDNEGGTYLTAKGDGVFPFGERKLFDEIETTTVRQAGGIKGPSRSIF